MSVISERRALPETTKDSSEGGTRVLSIALGGVGFLAVFVGSWIPSFWGDEAASVMSAERSLPSLLGMLRNVDAVHGVYYIFLHFWIDAFGASEISVRLPSAIAVGIAVAGTFFLGRALANRNAGIVAALLCAFLPRTGYTGADARSYAFTAAAAVWLTIFLLFLLRRDNARKWAWIGYAAGFTVGIYLFLYLGLLLAVHAVILVALHRRRAQLKYWLGAAVLAVALSLPILLLGYAERKQIAFLATRGYATPKSVLVSQGCGNPFLAVVAWLLLALATCSIVIAIRHSREIPPLALVGLSWLAIPTVGLLLLNVVTPAYNLRYLSFCVPGVALALADGLRMMKLRSLRPIAALLLLLLAVPTDVVQRGPYAKDGGSDLAQTAAFIDTASRPGEGIVFDESTAPRERPRLALHLFPGDFQGLTDATLATPYQERTELWDTTTPLQTDIGRLSHTDRVWLVELEGSPDSVGHTDLHTLEGAGFSVSSSTVIHRTIVYRLDRKQP